MRCGAIASARNSLCALFVVSSSIVGCGAESSGDLDVSVWKDAAVAEQVPFPPPSLRPCKLACPQPLMGANTICGRLFNAETGELMEVDGGACEFGTGAAARPSDASAVMTAGPSSRSVMDAAVQSAHFGAEGF